MKSWTIFLMALSVARASECDICFRERCLIATKLDFGSKNDLLGVSATFTKIDMKNNIMYLVRDEILQKIHLEDNIRNVVPTARECEAPLYLTVDQVNGNVYYSYGKYSTLYRYQPKSNETEVINQPTGDLMWAHNGTVYWYALTFKELYFIRGSSPKQSIASMKGIRVKDLAFDKFGNIYAGNRNTVYKIKANGDKTIIATGAYELAGDVAGDVYLIESTREFKIYQVDSESGQLKIVGALGRHNNYLRFMFDKYNNIIGKRILTANDWYHFKGTAIQGNCTTQ